MLTHRPNRVAIPAVLLFSLLALVSSISAEVPHQISYQGLLQDNTGTPVPDGLYDITFTIYDEDEIPLWTSGVLMIQVTDGLFTCALGSGNPIPDSVFGGGANRYLGIQVGNDPELTPRTQLLSSAYALQARGAELAHVFRLIPQDTPGPCDAGGRGEMYYDSAMNEPCYCTGTLWVQLDGGGTCECPDLDFDGFDICDAGHPRDNDGQPADCNDTDPEIGPGQFEILCDGIDQDCDGFDDGTEDFDGDGVSVCDGDCDDSDPSVSPNNEEFCNNVDDDCDGTVDEDAVDATIWYGDADNDGFGNAGNQALACNPPPGFVSDNSDCNDFNANVNPAAPEICDGQDNDCDGTVDDGVGPIWYADFDSDGFGDPSVSVQQCSQPPGYVFNNTDCNDANASVRPGAPEFCDGLDNDCDGQVDENAVDATPWYLDNDGDGYGQAGGFVMSCSAPPGRVANNLDCNDANSLVNPAASEVCGNGIDDDCDGQVDEGCP